MKRGERITVLHRAYRDSTAVHCSSLSCDLFQSSRVACSEPAAFRIAQTNRRIPMHSGHGMCLASVVNTTQRERPNCVATLSDLGLWPLRWHPRSLTCAVARYWCVCVWAVIQVELKMKSQLFYTAHQLVEAGPKQAVSWFAVGCYYHLLGKNELSQRYLLKVSSYSGSRYRNFSSLAFIRRFDLRSSWLVSNVVQLREGTTKYFGV